MLTKRIIACLDVKDGRVVKGVQFRNHVDMGDILELSQRYADEGVDELVFYDITASSDGRVVDKSWVNQIARRINIPFCVAGGIRSVADAKAILNDGADKISAEILSAPSFKIALASATDLIPPATQNGILMRRAIWFTQLLSTTRPSLLAVIS